MRYDQNQKTRFENLSCGHRFSTSEGGVITGEGGDDPFCGTGTIQPGQVRAGKP
jgi:hypothetical protein